MPCPAPKSQRDDVLKILLTGDLPLDWEVVDEELEVVAFLNRVGKLLQLPKHAKFNGSVRRRQTHHIISPQVPQEE